MWLPYASTCTGSSRLADARPVRRPPSSCFKTCKAPCMRRLISFMSCVAAAMALPLESRLVERSGSTSSDRWYDSDQPACPLRTDNCRAPLPLQDRLNRSLGVDREHDDRHMIFLGKREGGSIHDFQPALERLPVGQAVITLSGVVLLGISAVNPIDVGRFQDHLRSDLRGAKHGGRVSREKWIA